MKTTYRVDLVSELKNGTLNDIQEEYKILEKIKPTYNVAKEKVSHEHEEKISELKRIGFNLFSKEKQIISEYETVYNRITTKEKKCFFLW